MPLNPLAAQAEAFAESVWGLVPVEEARRMGVPEEEINRQLDANSPISQVSTPDPRYAIGKAGDEYIFEK